MSKLLIEQIVNKNHVKSEKELHDALAVKVIEQLEEQKVTIATEYFEEANKDITNLVTNDLVQLFVLDRDKAIDKITKISKAKNVDYKMLYSAVSNKSRSAAKKALNMKEMSSEEDKEELEEISKKTVLSYVKKAAVDHNTREKRTAFNVKHDIGHDQQGRDIKKLDNREKGMRRAEKRLTEDDEVVVYDAETNTAQPVTECKQSYTIFYKGTNNRSGKTIVEAVSLTEAKKAALNSLNRTKRNSSVHYRIIDGRLND